MSFNKSSPAGPLKAPARRFFLDTAGRPRCAAEGVRAAFRPLFCAMRAFTGILQCIVWHAYAGCSLYSYSECLLCKMNA